MGKYCSRPFTTIIHTGDITYPCCVSWLKINDDGLPSMAVQLKGTDAYYSDNFKLFRESIKDESYRYCSKSCPLLISKEGFVDKIPDESPTDIVLSNDYNCNLACISCRSHKYGTAKSIEVDYSEFDTITLSGSGDPFVSKYMLDIIGNYQNNKNYIIMTNGLLFDIDKFAEPEKISEVHISIDASTSETYTKVRGGDFNKLVDNIKSIRKITPIMKTSFTISKLNYLEVEDFIFFGLEHNFDEIMFRAVTDWGHLRHRFKELELNHDIIEHVQSIKENINNDKVIFSF